MEESKWYWFPKWMSEAYDHVAYSTLWSTPLSEVAFLDFLIFTLIILLLARPSKSD